MFKCECGREFEKANSFNAHKSHCKEHYLAKYGNLDFYNETHLARGKKSGNTQHEKFIQLEQTKLEQWISEKHSCEKCGKIMTEKFGSGRFCGQGCANSHDISIETRQKISESLTDKPKAVPQVRYCAVCGKVLSTQTKYDYCRVCYGASAEAFSLRSRLSCETRDKLRAEGKQFGFPSRKIISYPERFWITVLENNNINYEREVKVLNDHNSCYFLDFLIQAGDNQIDLEIDGAQHKKEERLLSDQQRDEFLSDTYIVYRIEWNEINTESGKLKMQQKIDAFLQFYKSFTV